MKFLYVGLVVLLCGCQIEYDHTKQIDVYKDGKLINSIVEATINTPTEKLKQERTVYQGHSVTYLCDLNEKLYIIKDKSSPILQDGFTCKYTVYEGQ